MASVDIYHWRMAKTIVRNAVTIYPATG